MPRDITVGQQADIAASITRPNYLLALTFPGGSVLRYAQLAEVTWDSVTWYEAGLLVSQANSQQAAFSLANADGTVGALVLANSLTSIGCEIWLHTGSDASPVFDGRLDDVPQIAERVPFTARAYTEANKFPATRIEGPTFRHLTPRGSRIVWGGGELVLD